VRRALEARCGDARREHEVDVEREVAARGEHPADAGLPHHVCDLVRVGPRPRWSARDDAPRELGRREERGLYVQVAVYEPRGEVAALEVDGAAGAVVAEAGGSRRRQSRPRSHHLVREDRDDAGVSEDEVGGLAPGGNVNSAFE